MILVPILLVLAVDHPSDYIHLNIPNPIPDADPRFFVAGGLCAAASHGITTPIDVIKTRVQADPQKFSKGILPSATTIILKDGPEALLKGLGPTVLGYGLEGAAKFGLYESLKPEMTQLLNLDSPAIPYLIASVISGAIASVMLCPLERTRIRLVTDPNFSSNFVTGIPRLVEESGLFGLFSGLPAMLSKQIPYTFGKQVSFDVLAKLLYTCFADASAPSTKSEVSFVAAFLASIVACILSQPGDVILTETYKQKDMSSVGFSQMVTAIYNHQGTGGFYSGLTARLIQVGSIITSQLILYDFIKQALGLPATGAS
jgi:solute carrier family 25 phosphate transporter 3